MSSLCQVLFAFFSRIAFIQWNLMKFCQYIGTPVFKLNKSVLKEGVVQGQGYLYTGI